MTPTVGLSQRAGRRLAAILAASPVARAIVLWGATAPRRWRTDFTRRALEAIARRAPDPPPLIDTTYGIADHLRLSAPSHKHSALFGRPDRDPRDGPVIELAKHLARDAGTFIDIGANDGIYTFSLAVDRTLAVDLHAFEPDPALFERLKHNAERNHIKATLNPLAISDASGSATFYRNLSSDVAGSLLPHDGDMVAVEVEVTTVAEYLRAHDIAQACIKIDVEGAGVAAWNGARPAIERIKWLIMEIIAPEAHARLIDQILATPGWSCYYIRGYELVRVRSSDERPHRDYLFDWLFCPATPDQLGQVLRGTRFRIIDARAAAT